MRFIAAIQAARRLMWYLPRKTQTQASTRLFYAPPHSTTTPPTPSPRFICSSSSSSVSPPSPPTSGTDSSDENESGQKTSGAPRLHMVFTCSVCETRAVKSFSKTAYETGVVIVTCPGCESRHLIADNLGWFGPQSESNIEKVLASKGQTVTRITDTDIDYTPSSNEPSKQ